MAINPYISIIVPIFNVGLYLSKCVNSLISQTFQDIEIILVDDGSTDNSIDICEKYAKIDNRIKVIRSKHQGTNGARKLGIYHASGPYVGFVDGDDYINNNMYENLYKIIKKYNVDFIDSGFVNDKTKSLLISQFPGHYSYLNLDKILFLLTNNAISYSLCSKLFKTDVIKKAIYNTPDNMCYGEDLLVLFKILFESHSIYILNEAYYNIVPRNDSATHQTNNNVISNICTLHMEYLNLINDYKLDLNFKDLFERYTSINFINLMKNRGMFQQNISYKIDPSKFIGSSIILYGAGKVGQDYYSQLSLYKNINIIGWVDMNFKNYNFDYFKINDIHDIDYSLADYILICIKNKNIVDEVFKFLLKKGHSLNKIIWTEPTCSTTF